MDFLTEEELFELQHQDEMDILDEMEVMNEIQYGPKTSKNKDVEGKSPCRQEEEKENIPDGPKTSKNKDVEGKSPCRQEEEKENIPVSRNAKRKLSFTEDFAQPSCSKYSSENQTFQDSSQYSQSLLEERSKRVFTDLSDDDQMDEINHSAKKSRLLVNETEENSLKNKVSTKAGSSAFGETRTFSKEQQMVTCIDGCRKYYSVNEEDDPHNLFPSFSQQTRSLLSTPIEELKRQYFNMEEEKELRRQYEEAVQASTLTDETIYEEKEIESSLWVEKYKPLCYMHLLSEEGINRTLLQWLKLWDKVVFGKEKKKVKKKNVEPKKNFQNPKFQKNLGELNEELDEHDRPYHKVAFLCGPPGLGKTTLAVIIAKQAGYNVIELNASDDRSPEIFRTSLENATQMKAVLHEDRKPNCLILDEIDGAPAPSINVLLSFIKSPGYTKGKRKKGDIPLLMRPIICICNDQYTAALKPLRQIALVLNFPPTTTPRLSSRLNEISMREGLEADTAALTLLCEKSSNDIRSCLSTLQFIHRMKKDLKVADLEGLTIGQKDMQKSLFAVWQDVFHYTEKPSFVEIHKIISSFGDFDKVYIGIFENYLNVKFKHRNANFVWDGAEWLCFGDIIQQEIFRNQSFFLLPYLPYPAVAFHLLFASNSYAQISYPAAFYEYRSRSTQLFNTMISLIKDMVSNLKSFLNSTLLLIDVFPFLLEIIKPSLRPVNTQLYSEREKSELKRVIELMIAFNLNYRQERMQDGTYSYVLDPNIEELIKFNGIKCNKALTYSAKQMIAREVEMEKMRKGEAAKEKLADTKVEKTADRKVEKTVVKPIPKSEPIRKTTVTEKPMLDFFGRKIVQSESVKKKAKGDPRDEEVWFHFKEGYSNAVRKTVYIKDLL